MGWWLLGVVVLLAVCDRVMLWAERRGWVFYRHRKPTSGSASSAAFGAVSDLFEPSRKTVVEQQQADRVRRQTFKAGEDE